MTYKVFVGRVTGKDILPPEKEEEQHTPPSSFPFTCNKCVNPSLSSIQANPDVKYCVCGGLLTPKSTITRVVDKVCALLSPPKSHVQSVQAGIDNIRVGVTVCRKIKMHQFGVVTNITYSWGTVKYISQVWVKWHGKPAATPYALTELLVITIH